MDITFANMRFHHWSIILFLGLTAFVVLLKSTEKNIVNGADTYGYYAYLPAAFIYGDLQNVDSSYRARAPYTHNPCTLPVDNSGELILAPKTGNRVIKYTLGVALLQTPFFFIGHFVAAMLPNVPMDGYSWPYRWAIQLSVFFWAWIGIWSLWKLLRRRFSADVSGWTLAGIVLGTHLFSFLVFRGPMSHSYLFALWSVLMLATVHFYDRPTSGRAILIGLAAGLITLIRPVEMVVLAIPLTYGLVNRAALKERWTLWRNNWSLLLLSVVVYICCGLLQLFYWKWVSGQWQFDTYPDEHFDFASSKIYHGLFGYNNGWVVYSPLIILALVGIVFLFKYRKWLWPVLIILPLHVYIAYSWWCWYYINGFGSRPMVELTALMSIPMAFFINAAWKRTWSKWLVAGLIIGASALQFFQSWQHSQHILVTEFANKAYYWSVFGRTEMTREALTAHSSHQRFPANRAAMTEKAILLDTGFESDSLGTQVDDIVYAGSKAVRLDPEQKFLTILEVAGKDLPDETTWIKVRAFCRKDITEGPFYAQAALQGIFERDQERILSNLVRIDRFLGNEEFSYFGGQRDVWSEIILWQKVPRDILPDDSYSVVFEVNQQSLWIDEVQVLAY